MFTWFDLMRQAQGSPDLDALARQFNLSTEQAQRAMAAFLPAFAMGVRQPAGLNDPMQMFRGLPGTPFTEFWSQAARAFTPQAHQAGKQVIDQLFGSDDTSRRVAHQAADFAGIGVETMQQMLPLMAGIFAGTLHQWMAAQGQMSQSAPSKPTSSKPSAPQPPDWAHLWDAWLGQASAGKGQAPATPFEAMMAPFMNPPSKPERGNSSAEAWERMMGAGHEMQKQYLASLQGIFESAWRQKPGRS
ncbi:DUF937 domain-containing protein [Microvirga pudoricolor]|uniref:DUF937 domain-containing protein n=1 Tax=Microvirga pudoricolor TaxID=2778729 RepID=UPI00194E8FD8|nr:DUF937 domain-containing protein [Microvirga pudoricolor]MBM6592682.1 DUF937 domain-containing protein [Microvirga pudoricolor]